MVIIVNIETSTEVCSVALSADNKVVWHKENYDGQSHSVLLAKYLSEMFAWAKDNRLEVNAVALSCGPGSYTGLRIGASTAKGLCYGLGVPLLSVPTLQLMAASVAGREGVCRDALLCPMIDARRMEVYTAMFDTKLEQKAEVKAEIVNSDSFADVHGEVLFFGNGASKCKDVLNRSNFKFLDGIVPLATDMVKISEQMYFEKKYEDVAYFEPFYLKDFVATVAKNKVLSV